MSNSAENWASTILSLSVQFLIIGKFTRVNGSDIRFYHRPDDGDSLHNFWQDVSAPTWNRTSTVCVHFHIYTYLWCVCVSVNIHTHTIYILYVDIAHTHTHVCIYLYPGSLPWGIMLPFQNKPDSWSALHVCIRSDSCRGIATDEHRAPC